MSFLRAVQGIYRKLGIPTDHGAPTAPPTIGELWPLLAEIDEQVSALGGFAAKRARMGRQRAERARNSERFRHEAFWVAKDAAELLKNQDEEPLPLLEWCKDRAHILVPSSVLDGELAELQRNAGITVWDERTQPWGPAAPRDVPNSGADATITELVEALGAYLEWIEEVDTGGPYISSRCQPTHALASRNSEQFASFYEANLRSMSQGISHASSYERYDDLFKHHYQLTLRERAFVPSPERDAELVRIQQERGITPREATPGPPG